MGPEMIKAVAVAAGLFVFMVLLLLGMIVDRLREIVRLLKDRD